MKKILKTIFNKSYYKHIIILLIFASIFLLFSLSIISAADVDVNNATSSIKEGLNAANSGDTLVLSSGNYTGNNNTGLTIDKNITIKGNGQAQDIVIDAQQTNRIFIMANNLNATFINITFANANITGNGGAIYNNYIGTMLTFINCTFLNNIASNSGGAIYNVGVNLNIINSKFTNNSASGNSSNYGGGAIYNTGGNFKVTNSVFITNIANGINSISGSTIGGGAIYNYNGDNMSISDSTFIDNNATNGGAVYNSGANLNITNTSFNNNSALTTSSTLGGGAISSTGVNMSVSNSNFTDNYASSGGAIRKGNNGFTITNSNFINNSAQYAGGAIYNTGANLKISNSNCTDNSARLDSITSAATKNGGAISNTGANLTIINSNFINNGLINGDSTGGAIYNSGVNFNIINCIFNNSTSRYNQGGCYGSAIFNSGDNFDVINCIFTNNRGYGGAIYNSANNFTVNNSNFTNNFAWSGGAIFNTGSNSDVINCIFTNNTANPGGSNSRGGAISNTGSNFSLTNSNFTNNTASADKGGTIYNIGVNMTVNNCNFTGGVAMIGGAIYNTGSNFTLNNSNFKDNNARLSSGYVSGYGGGIFNTVGDNFKIYNSNFNNNSAINGGSIFNTASYNFSVTYSNFTNSTANNGAAIYNNASDNFSVLSSNFNDNTASNIGGGIYNSGIGFTLVDSILKYNNAVIGGGVYNIGSIVINGSVFTNNTQAIGFASTDYQLNNNTIVNNTIAIQFVLNNKSYLIPDLIGLSSVVNILNIIANNTYAIGISGNYSNYTLANSTYNTSHNRNGVIFTGMGINSTNSSAAIGNILINSNINGYSDVGVTFDRSSRNNTVSISNISNNNIGLVFNGFNNSLVSSNVINNNLGINVTNNATGALINYNRIFNNTNYNGFEISNVPANTNANFNWWGDNTPLVNGINLSNYFVIELSANFFKTLVNASVIQSIGNVNLSYQFSLFNNTTKITSFANYDALPFFLVNITWKNGNTTIYSYNNVDARGNYSQIVDLRHNNSFSIEAIGDNEDILLNISPNTTGLVTIIINKTANVTGDILNGQNVTYIITAVNNGPNNATNVFITEKLQNSLIFLSVDTNGIGYYDSINGIWYIGNLDVGSKVTLIITFRTNITTNGSPINVTNIINVTSDQNNTDENETNVTITVVPVVNLTLSKTVNVTGVVFNGEIINYIITVVNNGPDNAANIIIHELLPYKLVYISSISSIGVYDPVTGVWNIPSLLTGANGTLVLFVSVNGTGNITNRINLTSDAHNIGENETNCTITVAYNTSIIAGGEFSEDRHSLLVTGKLIDGDGNPLVGKFVRFFVNGKYVGTAITDSFGVAKLIITQHSPFKGGLYTILAVFDGDENYPPCSDEYLLKLTEILDNKTNETNSSIDSHLNTHVSMKKTGFPLFSLVIILLLLSVVNFSMKKRSK